MSYKFSNTIFGAVVILLMGLFMSTPVGAQAANANAAQGMQISPALVELNASPGKTYNISLNIMNVTASDLKYTSSVDDFNSADETGSPHIILDGNLPESISVKTWISKIPGFTLEGRKSKVITAQINVPAKAEPGGHYGVLRFSGSTPEIKGTGVGVSASAGVLILIRVDGVITEEADLASFFSAKNGRQSWFFENGPIELVARIHNTGNIHIKPTGTVEVRDMFGGIVKTLPVNKEMSNVLPDSIRRFETQFNNSWMFGLYTANLTLGYGTTGQAITNTISFWVIPYKIILLGALVIAVMVYILSRLIKVYNRHIIEKSKNENKNNKQDGKKD